jgi:murein DD-endopeptidase MepM/ murein hydrolase activator NlpD
MDGDLCVWNGIDQLGAHAGYASFSYDLINLNGLPPTACGTQNVDGRTQGTPLYAPEGGWVAFVYDGAPDNCNSDGCWEPETVPGCVPCADPSQGPNPNCRYPANEIILLHRSGEYTEYHHLENGTIPQYIQDAYFSGMPLWLDKDTYIGTVGSSGSGGDHLHFSHYYAVTIDRPAEIELGDTCGYSVIGGPRDIVTRPFAFNNFYKWQNGTWTFVPRGTPNQGETFRYGF